MSKILSPPIEFEHEKLANIRRLGKNRMLQQYSRDWIKKVWKYKYPYHFTWLGRPIIQFPQDILAIQEMIWKVKPELIIETGIAHGGSLILSASLLELMGGKGKVLGIDIEIRPHNRRAIEKHPLRKRIHMLEGSSVDPVVLSQVNHFARGRKPTLVILDSNHTQVHVSQELRCYAPLVTPGSYLIVLDTLIEDMPNTLFKDRPWRKGNNPKTAVTAFLKNNSDFQMDRDLASKLLITASPYGYLKRIR